MAINKGKTEGGSGGKKGHSNMEHWDYTEEIKEETKKLRRLKGKQEIKGEIENEINNSKRPK